MQNSRKIIFGVAILGIVSSLCHGAFFYRADGYMSPETAMRLGLLRNDEASSLTEWCSGKARMVVMIIEKEGRLPSLVKQTTQTSTLLRSVSAWGDAS